jgi:protein-L-isoaspartate(D-aspartate) O-methyltransferase
MRRRFHAAAAAAAVASLLALAPLAAGPAAVGESRAAAAPVAVPHASCERAAERQRMVEEQVARRGLDDPRLPAAMVEVPRHRFLPFTRRSHAYDDEALPIGYGQTISQPYVVALMCDLLELAPDDKVLEIGTGSGYHAAVLSRLGGEVYSIEILRPLADRARRTLHRLGYDNVHVRMGDGYRGWPAAAPFDAILLTAAPPQIPQPLLDQLAPGGRLVAPVGEGAQELTRITRTGDGLRRETIATVYFVPMTGEAEREQPEAARVDAAEREAAEAAAAADGGAAKGGPGRP